MSSNCRAANACPSQVALEWVEMPSSMTRILKAGGPFNPFHELEHILVVPLQSCSCSSRRRSCMNLHDHVPFCFICRSPGTQTMSARMTSALSSSLRMCDPSICCCRCSAQGVAKGSFFFFGCQSSVSQQFSVSPTADGEKPPLASSLLRAQQQPSDPPPPPNPSLPSPPHRGPIS
jgi:hypothetical protein